MKAHLRRFADSPFGVFGFLDLIRDDGLAVARFCTGEDDWLDNHPKLSCIPAGDYLCKRVKSPKFGWTFEITGVPGRSAILFHSLNTEEDTEGCVGLGEDFGALTVDDEDQPGPGHRLKWAIIRSKLAVQRFLGLLAGLDSFPLKVSWAPPGSWRVTQD